ncbi:YcnI family protein [Agrococcus terreus]|uniref:DUF1775 domain-containing protein n=1 Tax=Agrococcus terreus TaxID=574649 RepID=UPI00384FEC6E
MPIRRPSDQHPRTGARRRAAGAALPALAAAAALALAAPAAASAHVKVGPESASPGETVDLAIAVGHGCDGSGTTAVSIAIPDGIAAVTPIQSPDWDVALTAVEGVRTLTYTAERPLPDAVRGQMHAQVVLRDDLAPGDVLELPAQQTCEQGAHAWDDLGPDAEEPMPIIQVVEAAPAEAAPAAVEAAPASQPLTIAALVAAVVAALLATVALRRQAGIRAGEAGR